MDVEVEYTALREEVLKRIEIRHAIISLTATIAGAILGFSIETKQLALIYPVIALSFCCMWAQNEIRELQICDYLQTIESKHGFGWSEYYKSVQAQGSFFRGIPISVIAPGSVFIITSGIAIGIAREILFTTVIMAILSIGDFLVIILMIYFMLRIRKSRLSRRKTHYHVYKNQL